MARQPRQLVVDLHSNDELPYLVARRKSPHQSSRQPCLTIIINPDGHVMREMINDRGFPGIMVKIEGPVGEEPICLMADPEAVEQYTKHLHFRFELCPQYLSFLLPWVFVELRLIYERWCAREAEEEAEEMKRRRRRELRRRRLEGPLNESDRRYSESISSSIERLLAHPCERLVWIDSYGINRKERKLTLKKKVIIVPRRMRLCLIGSSNLRQIFVDLANMTGFETRQRTKKRVEGMAKLVSILISGYSANPRQRKGHFAQGIESALEFLDRPCNRRFLRWPYLTRLCQILGSDRWCLLSALRARKMIKEEAYFLNYEPGRKNPLSEKPLSGFADLRELARSLQVDILRRPKRPASKGAMVIDLWLPPHPIGQPHEGDQFV